MNHKTKTVNGYTQTNRERNPNITLKVVIKPQWKKPKKRKERKKNKLKLMNKLLIKTNLSVITFNVKKLIAPI